MTAVTVSRPFEESHTRTFDDPAEADVYSREAQRTWPLVIVSRNGIVRHYRNRRVA